MKIIGVHHAQITIPKNTEEQAKNFYCNILGLCEIDKPATLEGRGGFWLKLANIEIHIGTEDGFNRLSTKAHIAYQVEDVCYWRNKLAKEGVEILDSVPISGFERFEFRDPFGNRVEMIQSL
ncbi:VOC family protein [Bacillus sp. B1-b2]|uniref:VOC family protein n=1 Tax=Bacillus sp. B1-b2 TaxID=2653201 RepID=UPI001262154C|nr:VOC family protein [Bacillus sp. B1-b2]KAB7673091.1 glyoxalase [Bacillus sp. B1-b2]